MYRGRTQLGKEITLQVQCRDTAGTPSLPDACPAVDVYSSSGQVIFGKLIPVLDPAILTGMFTYRLFLDELFSPGSYLVTYRWTVGSFKGADTDSFDVIAGGGASGAVISQFFYERPHSSFVVQDRDSGRTYKGRNPRL